MRIKLNFTVMKSYIEEHQNIWQLQLQTVWLLLLVIQNGRYSIIQKECQCQITIHLLFLTAQTTILQL